MLVSFLVVTSLGPPKHHQADRDLGDRKDLLPNHRVRFLSKCLGSARGESSSTTSPRPSPSPRRRLPWSWDKPSTPFTICTPSQYATGINSFLIYFRDIKPENFLLYKQDDDSHIKLIDFGLAKKVTKDELMTTPNGTPYYIAPEVLKGSYTT